VDSVSDMESLITCVVVNIHKYTWLCLDMAQDEKQSNSNIGLLLTRVLDEFKLINKNLESIIQLNIKALETQTKLLMVATDKKQTAPEIRLEPDAMTLLSLPLSLRKTVMVLYKLEKATADDLSKETNRLRAVESASANQLVRMGYIRKRREGLEVYFFIESSMEAQK